MCTKTNVASQQRPSDRPPVILRSNSCQNRLDCESRVSRIVDLLFRMIFSPGRCSNIESSEVNQGGGSESEWADEEDNVE